MAPHNRVPGHGRHRDHREHPRLRCYIQVKPILNSMWDVGFRLMFFILKFRILPNLLLNDYHVNPAIYSEVFQIYP